VNKKSDAQAAPGIFRCARQRTDVHAATAYLEFAVRLGHRPKDRPGEPDEIRCGIRAFSVRRFSKEN
jgi:hypothetical protein